MQLFTITDAERLGITHRQLAGRQFRRLFHGVYCRADQPMTAQLLVQAARRVLPRDAVLTGLSALHLAGVDYGAWLPLMFATDARVRRRGILTIPRRDDHSFPVASPACALVDADLGLVKTVEVAELLLSNQVCDLAQLRNQHELSSVLPYIRHPASSVRESRTRMILVLAGLPEPDLQVNITDASGAWIGRVDMAWPRYRVIVEYEGLQHATDTIQWQKDIDRYRRLELAGWQVIRVTSRHLVTPAELVNHVWAALRRAGFRGSPPRLDAAWLTAVTS